MPSVTDVQQQQQQQQPTSSSSNIHGKSTPPPSSQSVTTTDSTSTDPIIQAIQLLEKKQRNLGKRKEKLEGYQQEAKTGKDLNKDQKEALAKYPEVIGQIECVKELSEQLKKIQTESSKNQKRLLKQAADEKRQLVSQRLREYAKIRHLLDHRPASLKAEESALLDDLSAVIIPKDGSSDSISRSVETIVSIYQGTSSTTTIKNLPGKNAQEVREMLEQLLRSFEPQTPSSSSFSSSSVIVPEQTQEQKTEVNETEEIQPTNTTDTETDNNTNRNEVPVQLDTRTQNISYEQAIQNSLFLPDENENQNPDETHDEPSADSKQHIESLTIVNSNQQQQRSSSVDEQQHDESTNQTHSNDQQQRDEQWQHHQGHGNAQRGGQFHNGAANRPYHTGRSANYNPNWKGSYGGRYDNSSYGGGGGQRPYYDNQRGRGGSNSNYRGNRGGNYRYGGNRGYNNNGNGYHKSGQYQQNTHQQVHSAPPASTQQQ